MKKIFLIVASFGLFLIHFKEIHAQDIPTGKFRGDYYNGRNFETLVFTREDLEVSFDWWRRSPGTGVAPNDFSVRWQGRIDFTAGDWEFSAKSDDGIRVFVDGEIVIDSWKIQHGVIFKSIKNLSAGSHLIVVEYFEAAEWAAVHVNWRKIVPTTVSEGETPKPGTASTLPTVSPLYKGLYLSSCEDLTTSVSEGDAPLEVEFSGAGYDPYGAIQSYIFDFGDGTVDSKVALEDSYTTYIYEKPGNYKVTLTIKDSKGNLRTADVCKQDIVVGGYYKEGVGGYAEPTVFPSTVSALPKTGVFDSNLWLIFITIPMACFGLLLNRKFSKL